MSGMRGLVGLLLLALMVAACQSGGADPSDRMATQESCRMERVADLPARYVLGHVLIPAAVNDIPVQLLVDTGASASMLTPAAVALLGLHTDPSRTTTVHGIGGTVVTHDTSVQSFRIGDQDWLGSGMATGRLPIPFQEDPPVVGVLGADRLATFDVELDVPHRRMTLWRVQRCFGDFVPWQTAHYVLTLARYQPNQMIAHIEIEGHPVTALIDWGARSSMITSAAAAGLGVSEDILRQDRSGGSRGVDQNEVPIRVHRFGEITIGPARFHDIALEVGGLRVTNVGMLLGLDFFRTRHVWLSYASEQLFVERERIANAPR